MVGKDRPRQTRKHGVPGNSTMQPAEGHGFDASKQTSNHCFEARDGARAGSGAPLLQGAPWGRQPGAEQQLEVWSNTCRCWAVVLSTSREEGSPHTLLVEFRVPGGNVCRKRIWQDSPNLRTTLQLGELVADGQGAKQLEMSTVATCCGQVAEEYEVGNDDEQGCQGRALLHGPVQSRQEQQGSSTQLMEEAGELPQLFFADRFKLEYKIGSGLDPPRGSFSCVYAATDLKMGKEVAVKLESISSQHPQLLEEVQRYAALAGSPRLPQLLCHGSEGAYNFLVMDLLGASLEALFRRCNHSFSLSTTSRLGGQMLQCIRYVQSKGLVHRDVKPDNFAIGRGNAASQVHIMDFGLAKQYRDQSSFRHSPRRETAGFVGTARYASAGSHAGWEQSRRDDVEALGYVLTYFLKGELPWQGLGRGADKAERHRQIGKMKKSVPIRSLCEGLPPQFVNYFEHCAQLSFEDAPDYKYLQKLLEDALHEDQDTLNSLQFDWELVDNHTSTDALSSAAWCMNSNKCPVR